MSLPLSFAWVQQLTNLDSIRHAEEAQADAAAQGSPGMTAQASPAVAPHTAPGPAPMSSSGPVAAASAAAWVSPARSLTATFMGMPVVPGSAASHAAASAASPMLSVGLAVPAVEAQAVQMDQGWARQAGVGSGSVLGDILAAAAVPAVAGSSHDTLRAGLGPPPVAHSEGLDLPPAPSSSALEALRRAICPATTAHAVYTGQGVVATPSRPGSAAVAVQCCAARFRAVGQACLNIPGCSLVWLAVQVASSALKAGVVTSLFVMKAAVRCCCPEPVRSPCTRWCDAGQRAVRSWSSSAWILCTALAFCALLVHYFVLSMVWDSSSVPRSGPV